MALKREVDFSGGEGDHDGTDQERPGRECEHERRGWQEMNSGPGWLVCLDCGQVLPASMGAPRP